MNLPHFLDYISDGTLIITPGDRSDVILGSLAATSLKPIRIFPVFSLTGGLPLEPQVQRLIEGSAKSIADTHLLSVETDTYTTAMNASAVR